MIGFALRMKNSLIVISGPTAVGKTDLTIKLAGQSGSPVISADSRQFYRELKIGTAAPDLSEMKGVPHYFIGHKSIHEYYNVSMFEQDVLNLLPELFSKNPLVFLTGGSGLYIDAVCKGIDDMPEYDPELRKSLTERLHSEGVEGLRAELSRLDPRSYQTIDLKNPNRVLRAVEMCLLTGRPYSSFLSAVKRERPFRILNIALNLERDELHRRINARTDAMMLAGLEQEVRSLIPFRHLNALQTVGYKELFDYFDGITDLETAVELIKRNTRRYARRQISWLKREKTTYWTEPVKSEEILYVIQQFTGDE